MDRQRQVNPRLQAWLDGLPKGSEPLPDSVRDLVTQLIVRTSDGLVVFARASAAVEGTSFEAAKNMFQDKTGIEASFNDVHIDQLGDKQTVLTYTAQLIEAVDLIAANIQNAGFPGTYCIVGNVNNSEFLSSTVRFHTLRLEEGSWISGVDGFADTEGVLLETIVIP